jgi:hypothetical protein
VLDDILDLSCRGEECGFSLVIFLKLWTRSCRAYILIEKEPITNKRKYKKTSTFTKVTTRPPPKYFSLVMTLRQNSEINRRNGHSVPTMGTSAGARCDHFFFSFVFLSMLVLD